MLRTVLRPYCTHHKHRKRTRDEEMTCDHVLPRLLFKRLFGESAYKCSPAKALLDSGYNKQALPKSANNAAAFLIQEALASLASFRHSQDTQCVCLDCVHERLPHRRNTPLKASLQQGIAYLQDPRDRSLGCFKSTLCRTCRNLWEQFPEKRSELQQIACELRPLVSCRANKFISFCLVCNLPKKRKEMLKSRKRG